MYNTRKWSSHCVDMPDDGGTTPGCAIFFVAVEIPWAGLGQENWRWEMDSTVFVGIRFSPTFELSLPKVVPHDYGSRAGRMSSIPPYEYLKNMKGRTQVASEWNWISNWQWKFHDHPWSKFQLLSSQDGDSRSRLYCDTWTKCGDTTQGTGEDCGGAVRVTLHVFLRPYFWQVSFTTLI